MKVRAYPLDFSPKQHFPFFYNVFKVQVSTTLKNGFIGKNKSLELGIFCEAL